MSRWTDEFENTDFSNSFKMLVDKSKKLKLVANPSTSDVEELARLNKILTFIGNLLTACDPELMPFKTWENANGITQNALSNIQTFEENGDPTHIKEANTHLDSLIDKIKPYVVNGKGAAKAAGQAFRSYSKTIQETIKEVTSLNKSSIQSLSARKEALGALETEIQTAKDKIEKLTEELFDGTEEEDSTEDLIDTFFSEIKEYHEKLISGHGEDPSIIQEVATTKKRILEEKDDIEKSLQQTKDKVNELESFYVKIYGKKNDEGELEGGLDHDLNLKQNHLENFKKEQKTRYKALNKEIESLLPKATSAGLASAYYEWRKSFIIPLIWHSILFYFSIILLGVTALLIFVDQITFDKGIIFSSPTGWTELLINFLHRLPLSIPAVWLLIFTSNRRSENQRLHQEYAHKETVTKSFESFKKQIGEIQPENKNDQAELMRKLLEATIDTISYNPSNTLDGKHGDGTPLDSFLKTINKVLKKGGITLNVFGKDVD